MTDVWIAIWGKGECDSFDLGGATVRAFTTREAVHAWAKTLSPDVVADNLLIHHACGYSSYGYGSSLRIRRASLDVDKEYDKPANSGGIRGLLDWVMAKVQP